MEAQVDGALPWVLVVVGVLLLVALVVVVVQRRRRSGGVVVRQDLPGQDGSDTGGGS